jgi:hypothetical protein
MPDFDRPPVTVPLTFEWLSHGRFAGAAQVLIRAGSIGHPEAALALDIPPTTLWFYVVEERWYASLKHILQAAVAEALCPEASHTADAESGFDLTTLYEIISALPGPDDAGNGLHWTYLPPPLDLLLVARDLGLVAQEPGDEEYYSLTAAGAALRDMLEPLVAAINVAAIEFDREQAAAPSTTAAAPPLPNGEGCPPQAGGVGAVGGEV